MTEMILRLYFPIQKVKKDIRIAIKSINRIRDVTRMMIMRQTKILMIFYFAKFKFKKDLKCCRVEPYAKQNKNANLCDK